MQPPDGSGGPVYRGRPPGSRRARGRRGATSLSTVAERRMRRQLNRLVLVVATMFVVVIAATSLATRNDEPAAEVLVPVAGALPVQVERIIDGDTLDVRSAETVIRVRLYGVDTPERGDACFTEATERLTALAGDTVQLLPDARLQDSFDRELRYVYSEDGTFIDETLVREGFGLAWRDDGSRREVIIAAEEEARAAGRGCLWGD